MKPFNKIFRIVSGSEIARNISTLISGAVIAQLIPIALQPLLRRYYSPETFGAYAVYLSLVGILIIISSFKYELAIILPKKDKEAANVLILSQSLNLIFNVLVLLIIIFFNCPILKFLNLPEKYTLFIFLVPLGTFLYNFYQSINFWLIRQKAFFSVSLNKFVRRGFEGCSQVLFIVFGKTSGLLWGDLIGHGSNIISGLFQAFRKQFRFEEFSINKLKYVARKYIEYPKYNLLTSFMNSCSYLLPMILINKFYSTQNAGYFDLSKLLLSVPFAIIAGSISNVLLQRTSEKFKKKNSFRKEVSSLFLGVLVIALLEIIVITFFGVRLFQLVFGQEWTVSGKISVILVWSYALNFITSSFSSLFISLEKIKQLSLWQLIYFILILSLVLFKNLSYLDFLKVYVVIEVFCYMFYLILLFSTIKNYEISIREKVSL